MDAEQQHRDLGSGDGPSGRRWALFALLCVMAAGYLAAFGFYAARSSDFVAADADAAAREIAAAATPAAPASFRFVADSPDLIFLGGGWHTPEATGTWSRNLQARLYLPAPGKAVELHITGRVLLAAAHSRTHLDVILNGTPVASLVIDTVQPEVAMSAPVPASAADSPLELIFEVESTVKPSAIGVSSDERRLGFQLESIDVVTPTTAGAD